MLVRYCLCKCRNNIPTCAGAYLLHLIAFMYLKCSEFFCKNGNIVGTTFRLLFNLDCVCTMYIHVYTRTDQVTLAKVFAEGTTDDLPVSLSVHLTGQSTTVRPPALSLPGQH